MMKNINKNFLLMGCFAALAAPAAWAGPGVEIFGTGTYSMATGTPAPTSAFGIPGGGLALNFRLGSKVDLQLGGQYLTRSFTTALQTVTATLGQASLGFKVNLGKALYVNFGGYYNNYITHSVGIRPTEYGAYAGLGLKANLSNSVAFFINPRYNYALTTQTYAGGTYTPSEVQGIAGLVFGGMSK